MSSHADTIRAMLPSRGTPKTVWFTATEIESAHAALDALLAENQRLRDALEAMREVASVSLEDPWYAEQAGLDTSAIFKQAREALAGDAE